MMIHGVDVLEAISAASRRIGPEDKRMIGASPAVISRLPFPDLTVSPQA